MIICVYCNEELESFEGHHCINDLSFVKPKRSNFIYYAVGFTAAFILILAWFKGAI